MMHQQPDPQHESEFRRVLPLANNEVLVDCLLQVQTLLTMRQTTKGLGIHDERPETDQMYRLTLYTAREELLRRLAQSR